MLNCHPEARRTLSLFSTRPRRNFAAGRDGTVVNHATGFGVARSDNNFETS
jgi:hypothetical protein